MALKNAGFRNGDNDKLIKVDEAKIVNIIINNIKGNPLIIIANIERKTKIYITLKKSYENYDIE